MNHFTLYDSVFNTEFNEDSDSDIRINILFVLLDNYKNQKFLARLFESLQLEFS